MMEQENEREYLVDLQKLMTSEIGSTYWAHNMDLLAITTVDNLIELYRINYKAQKVFGTEETKSIKCLAFSPDSHLIAYGLVDGQLKIVKTENGERVVAVDGLHKNQIENLNFMPFCKLDPSTFLPARKHSIESRLILPISPHKNCNKNAIIKINYFREMSSEFTLLLSSQKERTLFLINGFIPAAQITYKQAKLSNIRVLYTYFDGKFISILAQSQPLINCIQWEYAAKQLSSLQEDIIKCNSIIAYINEIFIFIQGSYEAAEVLVRDILRQYNSKINLIDDSNTENVNPCDELFKYLNSGVTSAALIHFFTKQVFDTKILQKLDQTLNSIFAQLHDLLLQSIQNSLEKATLLLGQLVNLSQTQKFQIFGVKLSQLKAVEQKIIRLYTMGEILLVDSTQAKFDIRNLLVWLNKATIKSSPENQIEVENIKSSLNRYTVDFNRLHAFLASEQTFRLQNLVSCFAKENESRHRMQIRDPEFRILGSNKQQKSSNPELILNYNKLQSLLEVGDVYVPIQQKMEEEYIFKSFKAEVKQLSHIWKDLSDIPVKKISEIISRQFSQHSIGSVELSELFLFQIKTRLIDNELLIYYVQREENFDKLVEFNCHRRIKKYLKSTNSHILSLAVAKDVIAVFQQKMTSKRIIGQICNASFNGEQIQIGRMISKAEGDLDINSSLKGLNSLVIDKNKLVIFD